MLKQNLWIALLILTGASLTLAGCGRYQGAYHMKARESATIMRPLESKRTLIERLVAEEIQVVEEGDHLRMIIPVDPFFDMDKSTLRVSKEPALVLVAKLISLSTSAPVYVQGYSDNIGYDADNVRRSFRQANDIAAVLWAHGVEQRRLHVRGYGSKFPIADNGSVNGRAFNRRIEITN